MKAVAVVAPVPVVVTDSLFSQSDNKVFSNVAYFVKGYATETDLTNYVIASDVQNLNVYAVDANGDNVNYSLHGVAGKTLADALKATGNDEGITITVDELRSNYVEWFIDQDKKTKLVKLNLKAVKQKNTGLTSLIQKTDYTYSGGVKVTKVVTRYNEDGQPTGLRTKTEYAYSGSDLITEETFTSADGTNWTEKDKYIYVFDDKGVLRVVEYYEYSVSTSSYELVTKEFLHYSNDTPTFIRPDKNISTRMFPNPAVNVLNVSVKDLSSFEYKVYSLNGTLVKNGFANSSSAVINVSDLNRGIYMIQIIGEGRSFTSKFVKK